MNKKHWLLLTVSLFAVVSLLYSIYSMSPARATNDCKIIIQKELVTKKLSPAEVQQQFNDYVKQKEWLEDLTGCEVS